MRRTAPAAFIRHHPLLLSLYLPHLLIATTFGLMIPILPFYATDFNVSYGLVGLVLAGQAIGTLVSDIPAGIVVRRLGNRNTLLIGISLLGISTIALFWAQSIWLVIGLRLLSGAGRAMYLVAQHVTLANDVPHTQRGRATSLYGGVFRIGMLIGPALGGFIAFTFGIRIVFVVFAILCMLALVAVWLFTEKLSTKPKNKPKLAAEPQSPITVLRTHWRTLGTAGAGLFFAAVARAGRSAIVPLYGDEVLGLNVEEVGFIISIAALIDVILFPFAGVVMDRFGRKFAIVPCFGIQAIGMALIPFTTDYAGLLLATSLLAFGNGLGSGTMMTLGADLAPRSVRGEFLGLWHLIGDAGVSVAPLLVGLIADVLILRDAPFAIALAGFMASGIFFRFVPETLKRKRQNA